MCAFRVQKCSRVISRLPILLLFGWLPAAGFGDVLELANGGRVEGRLVDSPDGTKANVVIELATGGTLVLPRLQSRAGRFYFRGRSPVR